MSKLSQVIAIEKGVKTDAYAAFTTAHHNLQKPGPLSGVSRTYKPQDDEGEQFPPESTKVQVTAPDTINEVSKVLTRLFDVTATKEYGNTGATANVVVDGVVILEKVPVTYLLFLEKQLRDLTTFFAQLPMLDPSEDWSWDSAVGHWATAPYETVKTKKIPRNHVKAEATDKHPAQVEVYTEDVLVGRWKTIKFSGAMEADEVRALVDRVTKLAEAVKYAREQANSSEVADQRIGARVFDYLLDR